MKVSNRTILVFLILVMTSSCVLIDQWGDMSDKQRMLFVVSAYNGQYAILASDWQYYEALSVEQQRLLRWRRQLLIGAYKLVQRYVDHYQTHNERDVDLENQIIDVIKQISEAVVAPQEFEATQAEVL